MIPLLPQMKFVLLDAIILAFTTPPYSDTVIPSLTSKEHLLTVMNAYAGRAGYRKHRKILQVIERCFQLGLPQSIGVTCEVVAKAELIPFPSGAVNVGPFLEVEINHADGAAHAQVNQKPSALRTHLLPGIRALAERYAMLEAIGPALGCLIKAWMRANLYDTVPATAPATDVFKAIRERWLCECVVCPEVRKFFTAKHTDAVMTILGLSEDIVGHVEPWLTQEITDDIGKWVILQAPSSPELQQIWVCSLMFLGCRVR